MKNSRNNHDLLLETLSRMQEEKASLSLLVESLRNEIAVMRQSHAEEMKALRESFELSNENLRKTMQMTIEDLSNKNADLVRQLANAQAGVKLGRGKRFAPTTEQRNLLNNRSTDHRVKDKDDFDGTPPAAGATQEEETPKKKSNPKKRSAGRKPAKEE